MKSSRGVVPAAHARGAKRGPDELERPDKLHRRADGTAVTADTVMADAPPAAMHRVSVFGGAAATSASRESAEDPDQHKIAQRQKQIDHGKNTLAYDKYCRQVPRNQRDRTKPHHLRTPNPREAGISKRQFDGRVRDWRRKLHELWDSDGNPAEAPAGAEPRASESSSSCSTSLSRAVSASAGRSSLDAEAAARAETVFSLDDYLAGDEVDAPLLGYEEGPAELENGAKTPKTGLTTRVVTKTAPALPAAGAAAEAVEAKCPSMASLGTAGVALQGWEAEGGPSVAGLKAPVADQHLSGGGAAPAALAPAFDYDDYLGAHLLGSSCEPPTPPAAAKAHASGLGDGTAATAGSALRARLDAFKAEGAFAAAAGGADIYASFDGDDGLIG